MREILVERVQSNQQVEKINTSPVFFIWMCLFFILSNCKGQFCVYLC